MAHEMSFDEIARLAESIRNGEVIIKKIIPDKITEKTTVEVRHARPGGLPQKAKTEQAAKFDDGKIRPSLVPVQIIRDIAEVREFGVQKYKDPENWKNVELSRYVDALCRHLICYLEDPKSIDNESGLPHYKHIACNIAFICELMKGDKK